MLAAFHRAAERVPAYKRILAEAGVDPARVQDLAEFRRQVPVIDKAATFGRFGIAELCCEGSIAGVAAVLTSSGHSGRFAFGLYDAAGFDSGADRIDDALDAFFQVRSRPTLLVNCLPMGVKVYTRACTLGETSVRADMVTALVSGFGRYYEQIILVGDAAFVKHVLELGETQGIKWAERRPRIVVGEEPLAENARDYLASLAGIDLLRPESGLIVSSMGVGEIGLNLFFETPPLIALRRALHRDESLRRAVFGDGPRNLPMLFTYDPGRILVEVCEDRRLVLSTLDPACRLPLIRYATGDEAVLLSWSDPLAAAAGAAGISREALGALHIVGVRGRGDFVSAAGAAVYPEQIKEGLYRVGALARLTTANFRLAAGGRRAAVRIQLSPGVPPGPGLAERFAEAIAPYVQAPVEVTCEPYESFGGGMSLDYERKFDYLQKP